MLTMREDAIMKAFDKKIPFSEVRETTLSTISACDEPLAMRGNPVGSCRTGRKPPPDRTNRHMTDAKHKVLLLDDDKFLADMYSMKFTQSGYEVTACLSVDDALAAIKKGFDPDVILFDIVMPVQDGFAFCRRWRANTSRRPRYQNSAH